MKKIILSILAIFTLILPSFSQIDIDNDTVFLVMEDGVPHKAIITLSNNSGHDISLRWSLISSTLNDNDDGDGSNANNWAMQYCECNTCYNNDFNALPTGAQCADLMLDGSSVQWYLTVDPNGQAMTTGQWIIKVDNITDNITDTLVYTAYMPTAVEKVSYNASVNNYPNPANNVMIVEYELTNVNAPVLSVYNVVGSKVATYSLNGLNGRLNVNTSDLQNGMYFYTIEEEGQRVFIQKFNVVH